MHILELCCSYLNLILMLIHPLTIDQLMFVLQVERKSSRLVLRLSSDPLLSLSHAQMSLLCTLENTQFKSGPPDINHDIMPRWAPAGSTPFSLWEIRSVFQIAFWERIRQLAKFKTVSMNPFNCWLQHCPSMSGGWWLYHLDILHQFAFFP